MASPALHRSDAQAVAPSRGTVATHAAYTDIDEQAAALRGWNQSYQQLSAGRYRGAVRRAGVDGIDLFAEEIGPTVQQQGWVRDDVVALGVPLRLPGEGRFCGSHCTESALHLFSGSGGFEFRSPAAHTMIGIEIERPLFDRVLAAPAGLAGSALEIWQRAPRLMPLAPEALAPLRTRLVMALGLGPHANAATPAVAPQARRAALLDALLLALEASLKEPRGRTPADPPACGTARRALFDRARERVLDRLDQPPSVAELCAELGVSRRTLQAAFQDACGMGPLAWLRVLRLNAVRRALKSAPSVTAAAAQLGFWHFGRFSHDYRVLFGELPSDTFRRQGRRPH